MSSSSEFGVGANSATAFSGVDAIDVEPCGEVLGIDDRRHAVVNSVQKRVGRGRDDEGSVDSPPVASQ